MEIRSFMPKFPDGLIIELGGGVNGSAAFHPNLDARKGIGVDVIANFEYPLPIKTGACSGVFSKFCIEHISIQKVPQFISEIYRILKPDGKAIVFTMDLRVICERLTQLDRWKLSDLAVIFRGHDYQENIHRCGFSPELLDRVFREAGFQTTRLSHTYMGNDPFLEMWTDIIIEAWKEQVELKPYEEEFDLWNTRGISYDIHEP